MSLCHVSHHNKIIASGTDKMAVSLSSVAQTSNTYEGKKDLVNNLYQSHEQTITFIFSFSRNTNMNILRISPARHMRYGSVTVLSA